ncbi:MAG: 3-hydroxyacyl-CoA dehydrogenase [Nevskiaceae bacterium]|nr:MAG: 3-hydroxyacyl-CoA dehydrogenase [Nevskiaceae bacterium]TBR73960.1 MAG: 3-hydroxyacyl-CoA dehydrogenase [Nevskiaceae bacterium]
MDPRNKTFIVTGGASGLGKATATQLARAGANIVVADLKLDGADTLTAEFGKQIAVQRCDVTNEDDAQATVDAALKHFGGLHGLVNCAGIATGEKVVGKEGPHTLKSFARTLTINTIGTFNMIRLAANCLAKQPELEGGERGVIVNTASVAAFDGQIGQAAYSASKGAVVAMTLPIARELARYGIRVMTIAPGIFETPMMAGLPQEVQESLGRAVPFPPRLGRPAEYAGLVQHIVENQMLNGEVIRLDGAIRMQPR